MKQHEVQPERHSRADCQPGDLAGESVRPDILIGRRLSADQDHRDHRQHDAHRSRLARPFAERHADGDGHSSVEHRGKR